MGDVSLWQALDSAAKDVAELLNGSWTGDYADEFDGICDSSSKRAR
ncbi:hypothetical protein ACFYU5_17590 [Nocardia aobensis]|uniref:Uncharacterized protein n=1 Tax=Nocardia aobensis TaxID=257277 RepID=A0ABW6P5I2_9NOCA